ncbi:GNAT family N-acetyltransferase [Candidatus Poribacteria bacterium]
MLHELNKADYGKARPLFLPLEFHLTGLAVLDEMNPGRCFVDDTDAPKTVFLSSPEGCYLAGDPQNPEFSHALNRAIFDRSTLGEHVQMLDFVLASDAWGDGLVDVLYPRVPIAAPRRHYVCKEPMLGWQSHVPEGFTVSRITSEILNRPEVRIPDHVNGWMRHNWGSTSWFLESGFGFVTFHGDEVVSWSLADCVSGGCCEIGIHTATNYRRLGLATVTAAATVDYALSHGLSTVGWHCDEDNLGSSGTAEKVGFTRERDYTMYYMFLDESTHLAELARHRARG